MEKKRRIREMSDKKCKTINNFYDSKRGNYISHAPPHDKLKHQSMSFAITSLS